MIPCRAIRPWHRSGPWPDCDSGFRPCPIGSATILTALALHGEVTPETLERSERGCGVIVHWPRGRGEVFTAGTCEWVMGLTRRDVQVERVTRNVLDRFTA